eukprot:752813-Rhodomonas_salina.2
MVSQGLWLKLAAHCGVAGSAAAQCMLHPIPSTNLTSSSLPPNDSPTDPFSRNHPPETVQTFMLKCGLPIKALSAKTERTGEHEDDLEDMSGQRWHWRTVHWESAKAGSEMQDP